MPAFKLEQAGQQLGVIDVGAVRRIAVAAGTRVHADALALGVREPRQREIVEVDEAVQQLPGRIDLDREPPFGEVDLHLVRALVEAAPDFRLVLAQQVVDELLARVAGNPSAGYMRLSADGEITACLTGSVRVAQATSR